MSDAPNVVIVDDEATLAIVMRTLVLQGWPRAQVSIFTEPEDLPTRLSGIPHGAVVLMDRRLGGVDSYDLVRGLVRTRPDVRVAMLSASLGPEEVASARAAGAFAAYEKPGALSDWHRLLSTVIPPPGAAGTPGLGPAFA